MFENTADIIKQISLGEDSVLELKTVEFSRDKITGPHRNSMADELAAMANTHTGVVLLAQVPRFFNPKYFAKTNIVSKIKMLCD